MKRLGNRILERRLQRIETARGVRPDPHFPHLVIVHFVKPAKDGGPKPEPNFARLHNGDREWHRGTDESEEEFMARIEAEARGEGLITTVFVSDDDARL
jgi:hypothetical protein